MKNTVQISHKKIRIEIKDGNDCIGELSFNPDDTQTYEKYLAIYDSLVKGSKAFEGIDFSNKEEMKLETIDDFENNAESLDKIRETLKITSDILEDTCRELDGIFGEGVCALFLQGQKDPDLLSPLLDVVTPYFQKSRQLKMAKYKDKVK